MRSRLKKVLKGERKYSSTMKYVGRDIEFLKKWFEFQFDKDMTWENQGTYWHIDHVIPCSSFDLSNENEIYKCFNWKNLRPLEKIVNMSKNCKIDERVIINHRKIVLNFEIDNFFQTFR